MQPFQMLHTWEDPMEVVCPRLHYRMNIENVYVSPDECECTFFAEFFPAVILTFYYPDVSAYWLINTIIFSIPRLCAILCAKKFLSPPVINSKVSQGF